MKLPTIIALALGSSVALAEDWPAWGGHDLGRNMYSPAKGLPDKFDPGKVKTGGEDIDMATTKGVRWAAKLGSQSYGNVVVAGGKVYAGTNNESPRDKRHAGDRSCLYCFDEKSGNFLWQLVVPKLKSGKVNDWENLGLLASPLVEGNRLYVVTSRGEVLCLDTEGMANGNDGPYTDEAKYVVQDTGKPPIEPGKQDADIIWRYDMIDDLGVFPHNASNCSVLLLDGILYVCTSNGQDWTHVNVPSPNSPSFIALDAKTGKLLAEDNAGIGPRIFHGQWTSPSSGSVNGKNLIFFGGGDGVCYAFDAKPQKGDGSKIVPVLPGTPFDREEDKDTSYLKKVWWVDANPPEVKKVKYPQPEGPSEINATPVFYKNRVYVAVGQDPEHGEGIGRFLCIDATKTGDITKTGVIWDYKAIKRSISTASIDPKTGLLFIADFSGFIHCLDAETGKPYWVYDMKAHMWGSTMVADGKVYAGDEDGDVVVLAADKTLKVISEVNLGAPVLSTPVIANGVIYIGSQTHLFAVGGDGAPITDAPKGGVEIKNGNQFNPKRLSRASGQGKPDQSILADCLERDMANDPVSPDLIAQAKAQLNAHLKEIIQWHFSPETGCPYWLDWAKKNFDPRKEVQTFDDVLKFPHFQDESLRDMHPEVWVPAAFKGKPFNIFETGGTTGMPKQRIGWNDYKVDYEEFSGKIADEHFPRGGAWMMVGPTGPRRLRLAIEHLANFRGSSCYFIDLDPRWVKKVISNKQFDVARAYMDHVVDQAITILKNRKVSGLFTTPKLLEALAEKIDLYGAGIRGVFCGGTSMSPQYVRFLTEELLEGKIGFYPTYGNTLMGLAASVPIRPEDQFSVTYYAPQPRAVLRVVDPKNTAELVPYGSFGRVELTTMTREFFMPRFLERDEAIRRTPRAPYAWDGVGDVRPFGAMEKNIVEGVY